MLALTPPALGVRCPLAASHHIWYVPLCQPWPPWILLFVYLSTYCTRLSPSCRDGISHLSLCSCFLCRYLGFPGLCRQKPYLSRSMQHLCSWWQFLSKCLWSDWVAEWLMPHHFCIWLFPHAVDITCHTRCWWNHCGKGRSSPCRVGIKIQSEHTRQSKGRYSFPQSFSFISSWDQGLCFSIFSCDGCIDLPLAAHLLPTLPVGLGALTCTLYQCPWYALL